MTFLKFILNDKGEPVPVATLAEWARWFQTHDRQVGFTRIGGVHVSTVFLGLDHNYSEVGPPVLWESMIFGAAAGSLRETARRCAGAREQAEAMHAEMCAVVWPNIPREEFAVLHES